MRSSTRALLALVVALGLLGPAVSGCDNSDFYFIEYSRDTGAIPIGSNANIVLLEGWLSFDRDGQDWSCEVSTGDKASVDNDLAFVSNLTSGAAGDVAIIDRECDADWDDFTGRRINASVEAEYTIANLVYGDADVELEIDVSIDRNQGGDERAFVTEFAVCLDGDCYYE